MNTETNDNNLKIFENDLFKIRTTFIDDEPYFVAKDVADILEYSDTNAMTRRLDEDESISVKMSGMNMNSILLNESGLYSAILGSNKPQSKVFKKWITSEVLPSIRKTGGYILNKQPQTYLEAIEALVVKEKERLELEKKINSSTLFSNKEKVYDKERAYKKDISEIYPFIHNATATLILEYYTKSKYKETRSYIKDEADDVLDEFFADCEVRVTKNTVIVDHPCLLGAQLRIKKVFAIKYLGYTEENFKLSQSNN